MLIPLSGEWERFNVGKELEWSFFFSRKLITVLYDQPSGENLNKERKKNSLQILTLSCNVPFCIVKIITAFLTYCS